MPCFETIEGQKRLLRIRDQNRWVMAEPKANSWRQDPKQSSRNLKVTGSRSGSTDDVSAKDLANASDRSENLVTFVPGSRCWSKKSRPKQRSLVRLSKKDFVCWRTDLSTWPGAYPSPQKAKTEL